ncbi:PAS domain S-box protein [Natronomonas marina]|uniref:PAS domain S-box protein n=1 Tax=Natronomonas marina TaxID=2961939 RepID=UPI0020C98C06|nr:PAS domain S-box protein [Natronomonas marina]
MTAEFERSVRVACVGNFDDGIAALPDFDGVVRRVSTVDAVVPERVDCAVVVPHEGWESAVESLRRRRPSLPVVVAGRADPEVGAAVSRLGVEYAPIGAFEGSEGSLTARIRAIADDSASGGPPAVRADGGEAETRHERALRDLHRVSTADHDGFEALAEELLAVGCEYLDLDIGFLASVDEADDRFEVVSARGDHPKIQPGGVASLSTTYCRRAIDAESPLTVTDAASDPEWRADPAVEKYGLGCYVGGTITVDGETVGTLCFADEAAREVDFSAVERSFVELLVERVSHELEREDREAELRATRDRLNTVLERIDDGFFALDADWEFTYLNEFGAEIIRSAAASEVEEVVGRNLWEAVPSAEGTVFERNYRRAMENQESVDFEAYYEPLETWFGVSAYPSEEGLSVLFQDITRRKRREEALNALLSTTGELMTAHDREAIAAIGRDAAENVLGLEYVLVRLYDEEADVLYPAARSDAVATEMDERPRYAPGEGLPGRAFQRGEILAYDGTEAELPGEAGAIAAAYCLPLGDHGTVTVGTRADTQFEDDQRALAEILAANVRAALDRARRERRLDQYRAIHENVEQMVFVLDADGAVRLLTEPLATVLGVDPETARGTSAEAFLAAGASGPEGVLDELRGTAPDTSRTFEAALRTPDGELPVEIELSSLPGDRFDGAVGVVRDCSELETERARFSSLFERSPDPITDAVLTDHGPLLREVNPAFAETFGVDRETARGRSTNDLIVPDDHREEAERLDVLDPSDLLEPTEVVRETADGQGTFLFRGVHYAESEEGPRAFGIYTDITDRKLNERRIGMLNRVLRHNLRNSGTVVEGYLELLAAELDGETEEYADRALDAIDRIIALAERVRDIERALSVDRGDRRVVDLGRAVEEAVAAAGERNAAATFEVDVEDASVDGGDLFEKAVAELVENAAVHGGEAPTVTVTGSVDAETIRLAILDDGPGIPDRERAVVTGETDITQLNHSRGLGLWLAWYATTALGGTLSFDDDHDGGAVVLTLPREE